jgi:hypothetical protein
MPETSFVDSLVIADDERLRSLRPDRLVGVDTEERRRGTGAGIGGIAPPEAIDGKLRAAVNAGAIVSFVAGRNLLQQGTDLRAVIDILADRSAADGGGENASRSQ